MTGHHHRELCVKPARRTNWLIPVARRLLCGGIFRTAAPFTNPTVNSMTPNARGQSRAINMIVASQIPFEQSPFLSRVSLPIGVP